MKSEFLVEKNGKKFVLYAGLLDAAHQAGLASIRTELIQIPNETNGRTAICAAVVEMEADGVVRTFTGIGDAAPNNVGPAMQTCLIRMAETRAKARAIRDAINIGTAAFEELGEEAATGAPSRSGQGNSRRQASPPSASINTGPGTCRGCNAPAGRAHATNCKAAVAA
jgi:hypothetical protein